MFLTGRFLTLGLRAVGFGLARGLGARGAAVGDVAGGRLGPHDGVEFAQRFDLLGDDAAHGCGAGTGFLGQFGDAARQLGAGGFELAADFLGGVAHCPGGVVEAQGGVFDRLLHFGDHRLLGLAQRVVGALALAVGGVAEIAEAGGDVFAGLLQGLAERAGALVERLAQLAGMGGHSVAYGRGAVIDRGGQRIGGRGQHVADIAGGDRQRFTDASGVFVECGADLAGVVGQGMADLRGGVAECRADLQRGIVQCRLDLFGIVGEHRVDLRSVIRERIAHQIAGLMQGRGGGIAGAEQGAIDLGGAGVERVGEPLAGGIQRFVDARRGGGQHVGDVGRGGAQRLVDRRSGGRERIGHRVGGGLQCVVHGATGADQATFGIVDRIGDRLREHAHPAIDIVGARGKARGQRIHGATAVFQGFQRETAGAGKCVGGVAHIEGLFVQLAEHAGEFVHHRADGGLQRADMLADHDAGLFGLADRVAHGRGIGRGLLGDGGFQIRQIGGRGVEHALQQQIAVVELAERCGNVGEDARGRDRHDGFGFAGILAQRVAQHIAVALQGALQLVGFFFDQGREGAGVLFNRAVDVGQALADRVDGADGTHRHQLIDIGGGDPDLVERRADGEVHAVCRRGDVGGDGFGRQRDAGGNGFFDPVGAGFEIGHRLGDRGVDRGVERRQPLGGDIGAGGDRLGQGAQAAVDHIRDRLASRVDPGLDQVGGLARALAHGGAGGFDPGGHAAFGVGQALHGGVDATAEIVVHFGDLAGDDIRHGANAVGHGVGDIAQRRVELGAGFFALVGYGVGQLGGAQAQRLADRGGMGRQRIGQVLGAVAQGVGQLLGAGANGVGQVLCAAIKRGGQLGGALFQLGDEDAGMHVDLVGQIAATGIDLAGQRCSARIDLGGKRGGAFVQGAGEAVAALLNLAGKGGRAIIDLAGKRSGTIVDLPGQGGGAIIDLPSQRCSAVINLAGKRSSAVIELVGQGRGALCQRIGQALGAPGNRLVERLRAAGEGLAQFLGVQADGFAHVAAAAGQRFVQRAGAGFDGGGDLAGMGAEQFVQPLGAPVKGFGDQIGMTG